MSAGVDTGTNYFQLFFEKGYKHLVSVIPPGVEICPDIANYKGVVGSRGKCPGVLTDKGWRPYKWYAPETFEPHRDIDRWHKTGANLGVLCVNGLIALDVDCYDPELSQKLVAMAFHRLGKVPVRIGRAPKALLMYRIAEEDIPRAKYTALSFTDTTGTKVNRDGSPGKAAVEVLVNRQFVALGLYPAQNGEMGTSLYCWRGTNGELPAFDSLPTVNWSHVEELLEEMRGIVPEPGKRAVKGSAINRAAADQDALKGSREHVAKIVALIPNTGRYESMIEMAAAIRGACQDHDDLGLELFIDWCRRWEQDTCDEEQCEREFWSLTPPFALGVQKLDFMAAFGDGLQLGRDSNAPGTGKVMADPTRFLDIVPSLSDVEEAIVALHKVRPEAELAKSEDYQIETAEKAAPAAPIKLIDPASFYGREPAEKVFYVPGVVPQGEVTMLTGQGGVGKSLLALHILIAIALGLPVLGVETTQAVCLGFFCEDDEDVLHRRVRDICRGYGVDERELSGKLWLVCRKYEDNLLCAFDRAGTGVMLKPTPLYGELLALALSKGVKVSCLDTIADIFGGDEINRQQVRQFVQGCAGRLAAETGGACIILGHPSKSGQAEGGDGTSGSTAWHGSVRSRLYLTQKNDLGGDYRELRSMKANYGPAGATWTLQYVAGALQVVMASTVGSGGKAAITSHLGSTIVEAVRSANADGVRMTLGKTSKDKAAPILRRRAPDVFAPFSDREIEEAISQLLALGALKLGEVGRRPNRTPIEGLMIGAVDMPSEADEAPEEGTGGLFD